VVGDGDLLPGQELELVVQRGLVAFDDQQVGGVLVGDQPVGVLTLGVHGVGGDDPSGQVQAVQQRPEPGDLIGLGVDVDLSQDGTAGVLHRRQQVHRCGVVVAAAAQGLAVDGDCLPPWAGDGGGVAGGGCCLASQAPMARSSASASMRASTRRTVASSGGLGAPVQGSRRIPSAARTWPGASAAHSPIAASDLAPANTATTATPSTTARVCRRPRRWRGSASWARWSSRLRHWSGASVAGAASR
jgi:hypothetical protein